MSRGILITGTDTGVGKTLVTAATALVLRDRGCRVATMKPIETGVVTEGPFEVGSDAAILSECTSVPTSDEIVCPLRFRLPLAPSVAEVVEGKAIDIDQIERCYHEIASSSEVVLVEGCGGILVPLTNNFNIADLAKLLSLDVLIVARAGLGTINHTGLTVEAARSRNLNVLGVVLSGHDPNADDPSQESNRLQIETHFDVEVLGIVPKIVSGQATQDRLEELVSMFDTSTVCRRLLEVISGKATN